MAYCKGLETLSAGVDRLAKRTKLAFSGVVGHTILPRNFIER